MLKTLKKMVCAANRRLPRLGLVTQTWGNVSGIDRDRGLVVIKPSGIAYEDLTSDCMVVVDLTGAVVEGDYNPSSDTPTHLRLYEAFPDIGGVTHTHSTWATSFAQAGRPLEAYGSTHADYFYGPIPCTRALTEQEINNDYEWETGNVIVEALGDRNALAVPGALVKCHGPFVWGLTALDAVRNAVILEEIAKMAAITLTLAPGLQPVDQMLLDKHYNRKHGANAYYGQR
jgi:L-ribulose-5-phosphate 4-epimerase